MVGGVLAGLDAREALSMEDVPMGLGDMFQAAQDAEDAKRYRWLKSHIALTIIKRIDPEKIDQRPEALDDLIDCRMARGASTVTRDATP
jgi:hypothetical protein